MPPAPPAPPPLGEDEEELSESLMEFSNIGRTVDGTGFAYRSMSCVAKRVVPIKAIEPYVHLHEVDFSQNKIRDVGPLKHLRYILKLNLSQNQITTLKGWDSEEPILPHLVDLDLSGNQLVALPSLPFKALRIVNLARNEIATCQDFSGHEKLEQLDVSQNQLPALSGLAAMPSLKRLDVSSNHFADINGLADLPKLAELNLSKSKLEALEGPWQELSGLESLDLSGCLLAAPKPLEVLRHLPKLRTLQVKENPFMEADNGRIEVLCCHWRLTSIDDEAVTEQEVEQAQELNAQRLAEERARQQEAAGAGGDADD